MNILGNISDSLKYPLKNWLKLLILGVILMIPLVNFIGLGYYLKAIESTFEGYDRLPGFENFGELFVNGIKLFIVGIIYSIIPVIFFVIASGFGSLFLLLTIISATAISMFAFMGIGNMVYYNIEIGAALKYREILDIIKAIGWGKYIIWWIIILLIITVTGIIVSIIGEILLFYVLGFIFLSLGYGYLTLVQARSIALTFASNKY